MNKKLMALYIVSIMLTGVIAYHLAPNIKGMLEHQDTSIKTNVYVAIQNSFGVEQLDLGNVITDYGENITRNFFSGNGTVDNLDYIGIGNASPPLTGKTVLDSETSRLQGTIVNWTNGGDYALNVTRQFVSVTATTNGTALYTGPTGNNTYAMANYAQQAGTYNITIVWVITYDGN